MVFLCDKPYDGNIENPFPFELSDFQKYAIDAVIKGHHVLITAHTGSGKTLPAEFAIQHMVNKGKKVIYTSPIKALSNQKFFDFTNKYPHISFGLLTGDIKTNPTADVLIMTTEILMNSLFSKNTSDVPSNGELSFQMDIEHDLGCVIFDEVHYINDASRGQTWEQTILMLPLHIQMVMLSATIDNPIGFADWIENRDEKKGKTVYLASTEHRVVPLSHYGFFATTETPYKTIKDKTIHEQIRSVTNKFILLRNPTGQFQETGLHRIRDMSTLFDKHGWFMKRKFVLNRLAETLKRDEMLPAIVFVFSRKAVEQCAHEITANLLEDDSKVPYIMRYECEHIIRKFTNYKEYLELPEYNDLVSLLEKGIGIHHSGMIPVLREIVEIMISKKYIKLLFATESFAIGLDCPIKTAVFSALKKFDGNQLRYLLPHEYTQMAGRAGRRGIDTVGHVVHCNNLFELPSLPEYKEILCGKPQKLVSKFKMSYPIFLQHFVSSKEFAGKTDAFTNFVSQSMLQLEINASIRRSHAMIDEQQSLYDKNSGVVLRTPLEICEEFIEWEKNKQMYSSKKHKEMVKKVQAWKYDYKTFTDDVNKVVAQQEIKRSIEEERDHLSFMENSSLYHFQKLSAIMEDTGFLSNGEFTQYGTIASQIHEIHPLLGGDMFQHTEFVTYSSKQIVTFLSIFTDISLPEEMRAYHPPETTDSIVIKDIRTIEKRANDYEKRELEANVYSLPVTFTYDLLDIMEEWCDCQTEVECKRLVQEKIAQRNISVGDFTKAILKIVVIVKEFQPIAERLNNLSFLTALKEIEPMVLKYVATNQSLYV